MQRALLLAFPPSPLWCLLSVEWLRYNMLHSTVVARPHCASSLRRSSRLRAAPLVPGAPQTLYEPGDDGLFVDEAATLAAAGVQPDALISAAKARASAVARAWEHCTLTVLALRTLL